MDKMIMSNSSIQIDDEEMNDALTLLQLSQFSTMAIDPSHEITRATPTKIIPDVQADDLTNTTCSSSFKSSVSSSSQLSGWGSVVSRKSYACLRTLEAESAKRSTAGLVSNTFAQQQQQRRIDEHNLYQQQQLQRSYIQQQQQQHPFVGDSWGYFVDTPDY